MTSERVERRLAAVLAADVVGYSRLMEIDEVGTLSTLKALRRELIDPTIAEHNGRIVKTTGDGLLVVFSSAVDAVSCAMQVQIKMAASVSDNSQQILLRIGINVGDIIVDGDDIFGDGVNVASRVESECEPGSVYLSGNAFEQVRGKVSFAFDDVGEKSLKNIDRPVRLYAVKPLASSAAKSTIDQGKRLRRQVHGRTTGATQPGMANLLAQPRAGHCAMDLFVVPTVGFDLLYAFVIVRLGRRELVWTNVIANPTTEWVARQITEAFPWGR